MNDTWRQPPVPHGDDQDGDGQKKLPRWSHLIDVQAGFTHTQSEAQALLHLWLLTASKKLMGSADLDHHLPGLVSYPSRCESQLRFLADRTNGRAIGTVLRLSVCLSVTLCIVAKRCVLEQKLLLRAYRKSYMRNRLVPK